MRMTSVHISMICFHIVTPPVHHKTPLALIAQPSLPSCSINTGLCEMRRGRLPLTALRAFEAAGRAESISLAARELHVSQAAVSRQIKELEDQLNLALFDRIHRGVRLTASGHRLLVSLTQAFDGIDDALRDISAPKIETLLISCEPAFAALWLAPRLSAFREIAQDSDVVLNSDSHLVDFGNDGTTFAIRCSTERQNWPRVEAQKLCESYLSAYLSPRLLAAKNISLPHDLLPLPRFHEDTREDWCSWFEAAGVAQPDTDRGTVFNDSAVMFQAALAGQGVMLADDLLAKPAAERGELVRPFNITIHSGSYWLVSRNFNHLSKNASRFVDWLIEELREP